MEMIQVKVFRPVEDSDKRWEKTVWVDKSWNVKVGNCIAFTDDLEIYWEVSDVYKTVSNDGDLHKKWGLALPKSQRTER